MATDSAEGLAVLGYIAVMSRWRWLIAAILVACLAAGFAYLRTQTPLYSATTKLLYVQPVTISNPLVQGGYSQAYQQPDIATISAMVTSSQVTEAAFKLLKGKDTSAGYFINATQPADSAGNSSESVIGVEAVSADPEAAALAANATAQAFVDWRRDSRGAQVEEALTAVKAALQTYSNSSARQSTEYLQLRQSEQALELQLQSLSSDFMITVPATVPTVPFSPRTRHTLALAGIMGLALAMGLAFLLEQLDTKVRDERQMMELLQMPALGHLPPLSRRSAEGAEVQMLSNPSGPMAEAIRVLRGNLSFTGVDDDVHAVLITSSIRSEGKSVTASNLAVSMALAGQRVVLVDGDFRRPRVHSYMRVSNVVGLSSVLARRAELADAVIPVSLEGQGDGDVPAPDVLARGRAGAHVMSAAGAGRGEEPTFRYLSLHAAGGSGSGSDALLRVLPSGPLPPNPGEMAASQRFGEIIGELAQTADLVIVDAPPILEVGDAAAMASRADGVLFVVNLSRVRWPMLERSQAQLERFPCRKLGMVVVATKQARRAGYGYEYRAASSPKGSPPSDGHM